jgi:hypothetical protein
MECPHAWHSQKAPVHTEQSCIWQLRLVGVTAAALCLQLVAQVAHVAAPEIERQCGCQLRSDTALPLLAGAFQEVPQQDLQAAGVIGPLHMAGRASNCRDPLQRLFAHLLSGLLPCSVLDVQAVVRHTRLQVVGEPLPKRTARPTKVREACPVSRCAAVQHLNVMSAASFASGYLHEQFQCRQSCTDAVQYGVAVMEITCRAKRYPGGEQSHATLQRLPLSRHTVPAALAGAATAPAVPGHRCFSKALAACSCLVDLH